MAFNNTTGYVIDPTYLHRVGCLIWSDIEHAVKHLIYTMEYNHYRPEIIVGVTRGGLIPAVMLSHLLGVPRVEALPLQLRDGKSSREAYGAHTWHMQSDVYNNQRALFVDDLWDSGETMEKIGTVWPEALRATLFHKTEMQPHPIGPKASIGRLPPINFPGLWVPPDKWVVFPWEQPPTLKQQEGREKSGPSS